MSEAKVRYIKLGSGGSWEAECLGLESHRDAPQTLRLGFWTGDPEMFERCQAKDWDGVANLLRQRRGKGPNASVKDDLRQVQAVFGDDGSTLWITFHKRVMYWGHIDPDRVPEPFPGGSTHFMRAPGWIDRTTDPTEARLLMDDLAGHLGKVTQYRGTICTPQDPAYVRRRIAGSESKLAEDARKAIVELEQSIAEMIRQLTPYDFEALVDMTFAASGWRRLGAAGKTEQDIDLVLVRSSIGGDPSLGRVDGLERVGVQIKSHASTATFNSAAPRLCTYDRALFVYHSGHVDNDKHPEVELVGVKRLAPMVLDAGLTRWLLRRVR